MSHLSYGRFPRPLPGRPSDWSDGPSCQRILLAPGEQAPSRKVADEDKELVGKTPAARLLDLHAKRAAIGLPTPAKPYAIAPEPVAPKRIPVTSAESLAWKRTYRMTPLGRLTHQIAKAHKAIREARSDAVREQHGLELQQLIVERTAMKGGGA